MDKVITLADFYDPNQQPVEPVKPCIKSESCSEVSNIFQRYSRLSDPQLYMS